MTADLVSFFVNLEETGNRAFQSTDNGFEIGAQRLKTLERCQNRQGNPTLIFRHFVLEELISNHIDIAEIVFDLSDDLLLQFRTGERRCGLRQCGDDIRTVRSRRNKLSTSSRDDRRCLLICFVHGGRGGDWLIRIDLEGRRWISPAHVLLLTVLVLVTVVTTSPFTSVSSVDAMVFASATVSVIFVWIAAVGRITNLEENGRRKYSLKISVFLPRMSCLSVRRRMFVYGRKRDEETFLKQTIEAKNTKKTKKKMHLNDHVRQNTRYVYTSTNRSSLQREKERTRR